MPRGDRTGPMGMGSMTGRGAGFCAGYAMPGYENPVYAGGFVEGVGQGYWHRGFRGGGRGWRHWFYATGLPRWARFGAGAFSYSAPDANLEKQALKDRMEALRIELDFMEKRLAQIETSARKE